MMHTITTYRLNVGGHSFWPNNVEPGHFQHPFSGIDLYWNPELFAVQFTPTTGPVIGVVG